MAKIAGKANISKKMVEDKSQSLSANLVYMNDGIRVCTEACACCWDKPIPDTYDEMVDYLGKRTRIGHTSILEHSNMIIVVKLGYIVNSLDVLSVFDMLASAKYLNVRLSSDSHNVPYLLIGGSYRGYDEMYKLCKNKENYCLRTIADIIYQNIHSKIFYDLVLDNVLLKEKFFNVEPDPVSKYFNPKKTYYESDKLQFVSVDNMNQIKENLIQIIGEDIFTMDDIARVASLTILFKDMSRTATHQLVRHRNAITQESQRYVDYSDAAFADPTSFKPDRYDSNKDYTVKFAGVEFHMTSMQLGENIIGLYDDMRNQGMMKEDARSFLPGNVKCRKLYMTFTYATYVKFLQLRCEPGAQAEIRSYAIEARDASKNIFEDLKAEVAPVGVDEIITDKEVIMNNIIAAEPELQNEG